MSQRNIPAKPKTAATLEKLRPGEGVAVLNQLLNKHPELKLEAEQLATQMISTASIADVAQEVYLELTSIDLEALNGRAGSHSWGYVEPSEAAAELLAEAIEDRLEEMKRSLELGLLAVAEALCTGMVQGLYRARNTNSDGPLGWAVDFPADEAGYIVEEFLKGCIPSSREAAGKNLMQLLTEQAPEWEEALQRVAEQVAKANPTT
jgi:hypothetical protein